MHYIKTDSDRTKHRARGAHKQIVGRFEDTQNSTFDVIEKIRRSNDGVQSNADRL